MALIDEFDCISRFYLYAHGVRVATLSDVGRVEARYLRGREEDERGEPVLLYDRYHRLVPETASYR